MHVYVTKTVKSIVSIKTSVYLTQSYFSVNNVLNYIQLFIYLNNLLQQMNICAVLCNVELANLQLI